MLPIVTASTIYSTLGNNSSLVPLAIKDIANSIGLTAGSYATGDKLEGKDRFVDEFGTQGIWLFGLPIFKGVTDLTLYKFLKIDPKVDVRLLDNKDILDKAIELSPQVVKKGKNSIDENYLATGLKAMKANPKFSRNLALTKFGVATALTIASYVGLTKYRHIQTRKEAMKEILAEQQKNQKANPQQQQNTDKFTYTKTSMADFTSKNNDKPSFTGAPDLVSKGVSALKDFMFDPVRNLMIVDGSITAERLSHSRNGQEFLGYAIKEGSFWGFMYFASKPIQKFLENQCVKNHNKSIDLDARVIESKDLKEALSNKVEFEKHMAHFPANATDVELYEYLHKNPDNFVVKMAKKSDEIPTLGAADNWVNKLKKSLNMAYLEIKDKDAIDTRQFIDLGDAKKKTGVRGVHSKLQQLYAQYLSSEEPLDTFLNSVKKYKRQAVRINLGSCVAALGIAAPLIMMAVRYLGNDKDFQVKEDLKKELNFKG